MDYLKSDHKANIRIIRFVDVPDAKVAQLIYDITDERAGRNCQIMVTRQLDLHPYLITVEVWIYL